jgi:hypothetical protein
MKELPGTIDRELLGDVDEFAAAVVALAGVAFGVLVGQNRALRLEHTRTRVVLRGDQLDMFLLTLELSGERASELGVEGGDGAVGVVHEGCRGRGYGILASDGRFLGPYAARLAL